MRISLGEELMMPTAMLYRNLMAMDVEEMIRSNPLDRVVLSCGCEDDTGSTDGCCQHGCPIDPGFRRTNVTGNVEE